MLGIEESKTLFSLLDAESRPFADVVADFLSRFPRDSHFRAFCSLAALLEDKKMLKLSQRLIAFAILHQTYSSQSLSSNPFLSFLIDAACDETSEKSELAFVQLLLGPDSGNSSKEILGQSAVNYIKGFDPTSQVLLQREQLEEQLCNDPQAQPYASIFRTATVRNVIPDPDVPQDSVANSSELKLSPAGAKPRNDSEERESALTDLLQNVSLEGLSPQWIRPAPPRLPVFEGELVWLNPDNNHEPLWDYSMCADTSRGAAVRDLIARALRGPLLPAQQEVSL